MSVRLDKWLQVARLFKNRALAAHACELGRVAVNGQPAKPHRHLVVGDRLEWKAGDWQRAVVVAALADRPVPKAQAPTLYEDQSAERPATDPLARLMARQPARRAAGAGRPTKKERRDLERFQLDGTGGLPPEDDEDSEDEDDD